jgi:hypothetical protein
MNDNDAMAGLYDMAHLPPEEFQMEFIDLPDGGIQVRVNITGRTRELVKLQAAAHGMSMHECVGYCMQRDLS